MSAASRPAALQKRAWLGRAIAGGAGAWPVRAVLVAVGVAALAAASWIVVPMVPVPMTLQTLAVGLLGAAYGWRLGLATIVAYLAAAALGAPILAGGAAGVAALAGKTGGYLFAFLPAVALVGVLAARGWMASLPRALAVMLAAHALILALGVAWLAVAIGPERAIAAGLTPFLAGAAVKSVLATVGARVLAWHGFVRTSEGG